MRHLLKIISIVATFAAVALFAVPTADAQGQNGNAHVCISVNGRTVVQKGNATCFSTPGNRAQAHGDGSFASASGTRSVARARNGATAIAFDSANGYAQADGAGSLASTTRGTNQRAIATGGGGAVIIDCVNESISSTDGSTQFKAC